MKPSIRATLTRMSHERRKHTPEQVLAVRRDLEAGMSQVEVARKHNVKAVWVHEIATNRMWVSTR